MELIFNKVGKYYESVFELTADANLHIEFNNASPVKLYQRTTGGGWDLVDDVKNAVGKVTDIDLTSLIYPKYIKVTSEVNPTYAEVVSNGEITELKYQEKSVEVTANGNTEVIPDAGFAGLTKVNVSVNVPQSGGGNEGEGDAPSGGGGGNIEYLDTSNADQDMVKEVLIAMGLYARIRLSASMNFTAHLPCAMVMRLATIQNSFDKVLAIAIDFSARVRQFGGDFMTIKDYLLQTGVSEEAIASLPRITKEEFYNLNA